MRIYLANGLFSLADFKLNEIIARMIRERYEEAEVFVPQEAEINDKNAYASSKEIFQMDFDALKDSNLLVAVIDGVEIDSGVACEIGIANALGIPIVALYTDVRQQGRTNRRKIDALIEDGVENQFMYRNLFVVGAIKQRGLIVSTLEELVDSVGEYIEI